MTATQTEHVNEAEVKGCESLGCKEADAQRIVRNNMLWAMGVSAVPVPIVDLVGVIGFQARAIKSLSDLYRIPFYEHKFKNVLAILLSGLGSIQLGAALGRSFLKTLPIVGTILPFTALPLAAGALTYATGKVFIQHFESGGTFLDLNPSKVRAYFKEQFEEGMKVAADLKNSAKATTTAKA